MNFTEDILQNIEDYLNGSMNIEKIKLFEYQIDVDAELAEAVEINRKLRLQYDEENWDFIKDDSTKIEISNLESLLKTKDFINSKEAIQSAGESYFSNEIVGFSKRSRSKIYFAIAVAAVLIVFLGISFKDNSLSNRDVYSSYSDWSELPSFVSRGETNKDILIIGENAFVNKNYKLASESFSLYVENQTELNSTALLYLGISQLELNKNELALGNFQKLTSSNSIDKSKGYWYSALAYFKMDETENAIKELNNILKSKSNFNYEKANELLGILKK